MPELCEAFSTYWRILSPGRYIFLPSGQNRPVRSLAKEVTHMDKNKSSNQTSNQTGSQNCKGTDKKSSQTTDKK